MSEVISSNESPTDRDRFAFGANWRSFLETLDEERISRGIESVEGLLREPTAPNSAEKAFSLAGKRMLDLGSGSGLFSLAAHRLGAQVLSIDYDVDSVHCTKHLQQTYGTENPAWEVRQGSALDENLMGSLGTFDVVYSWGVLHHTGDMWRAIELAADRVAPEGKFVLSIYNDQGNASRRWKRIKQIYNRLPKFFQPLWVSVIAGFYELKFAAARLKNGRNPLPWQDWKDKKKDRGMSAWHDWVDWVGGLPFEVATPDEIVSFLKPRGFKTLQIHPVGKGWGCNEFVFCKTES